jgi:S-adenosylmethionine:tRNA ribosyltransferase-isomerase
LIKTPTTDLEYNLKDSSIAQFRYKEPGNSKLLLASTKQILTFDNYIKNIKQKSVFIFNKSSVQNVRILTNKVKTNGKVEFFILSILTTNTAEVLIKTSSNLSPGEVINTFLADVRIVEKNNSIFTVDFNTKVQDLIDKYGKVPLPPYIKDDVSKYEDYKNKFSDGGFSVASSTAGLHFSLRMISDLIKNGHKIFYINLDINLGTFKQIDSATVEDYKIHSESYSMSKSDFESILLLKGEGYNIVTVGTTVLRTLETVAVNNIYQGLTNLFITPGYKFRISDTLITNFHAPRSSLLSIVQTIFGDNWKDLYSFAQSNHLKFLSFGDAVLFNIDE